MPGLGVCSRQKKMGRSNQVRFGIVKICCRGREVGAFKAAHKDSFGRNGHGCFLQIWVVYFGNERLDEKAEKTPASAAGACMKPSLLSNFPSPTSNFVGAGSRPGRAQIYPVKPFTGIYAKSGPERRPGAPALSAQRGAPLCQATPCLGQNSTMQQLSHIALRAVQQARPCSTQRWQKSLLSSGGRSLRISTSTL